MSDKNYTTKKVELPLSTDKEYVLVDVEGYISQPEYSEETVRECQMDKPFKLDAVDSDGWGEINDHYIIVPIDRRPSECEVSFFREVIRDTPVTPQEDDEFKAKSDVVSEEIVVEWKNGDACVYDGREYAFVGMTPTLDNVSCILFSSENGVEHVSVNKLSKPETEAERIERERNNAVYDMCSAVDNFTEESRFWAEKFHDAGYRK